MSGTATQQHKITTEEVRNVSVDFTNQLDTGELLSGTPTVTSDTDVTITNEQRNSAPVVINGVTVAIDMAVQFTIECSVVGLYPIEIQVDTDASQTLEGVVVVKVVATEF